MPIRTMFQHRDARRRVSLTVLCVAIVGFGVPRAHASWCEHGVWVDAMLGSYHIDPDPSKHFEPFNPGSASSVISRRSGGRRQGTFAIRFGVHRSTAAPYGHRSLSIGEGSGSPRWAA